MRCLRRGCSPLPERSRAIGVMSRPDWAAIHRELKRKHVTLQILWDEYIEREPQGYRYSRFCELYRAWESRLSVTMRQSHAASDKLESGEPVHASGFSPLSCAGRSTPAHGRVLRCGRASGLT